MSLVSELCPVQLKLCFPPKGGSTYIIAFGVLLTAFNIAWSFESFKRPERSFSVAPSSWNRGSWGQEIICAPNTPQLFQNRAQLRIRGPWQTFRSVFTCQALLSLVTNSQLMGEWWGSKLEFKRGKEEGRKKRKKGKKERYLIWGGKDLLQTVLKQAIALQKLPPAV